LKDAIWFENKWIAQMKPVRYCAQYVHEAVCVKAIYVTENRSMQLKIVIIVCKLFAGDW